MKIKGSVEIEIDDKALANAITQKIQSIMGKDFDDAGCSWLTDNNGNTYIGDETWLASSNPFVAVLVDSANYLSYNRFLKV